VYGTEIPSSVPYSKNITDVIFHEEILHPVQVVMFINNVLIPAVHLQYPLIKYPLLLPLVISNPEP
jgi:hypothetical protein